MARRVTVQLNVGIDPEIFRKLKHVCIDREESMATFVEDAVAARLGQILNANAGRLGMMRERVEIRTRNTGDKEVDMLEAMHRLPAREPGATSVRKRRVRKRR